MLKDSPVMQTEQNILFSLIWNLTIPFSKNLRKFQLDKFLNCAACLVSEKTIRKHVTPMLKHINAPIDYKTVTIYKCINILAPAYLSQNAINSSIIKKNAEKPNIYSFYSAFCNHMRIKVVIIG